MTGRINSDGRTRRFTLEYTPQRFRRRVTGDTVHAFRASLSERERFELDRAYGQSLAERLQGKTDAA